MNEWVRKGSDYKEAQKKKEAYCFDFKNEHLCDGEKC